MMSGRQAIPIIIRRDSNKIYKIRSVPLGRTCSKGGK